MNDKITTAAFYFPDFHTDRRNEQIHGKGWSEWELIRRNRPRFPGHEVFNTPLWGYEDEANPAVMAKKIAAAHEHHLDVWIFDWYYYDDGPFLEGCLDRGFLQAANRNDMRFSLMWANHDWYDIHGYDPTQGEAKLLYPGRVTEETFHRICGLVIEKYFSQENYWKIDGCPVFSIYEIGTLALSFADTAAMRRALDHFRSRVKQAGFPDLHLNVMYWGMPNLPGGRTPENWQQLFDELSVDSAASYTWIHHGVMPKFPESDYAEARERYWRVWDETTETFDIPYFPNVTMGWDNSPRAVPGVPWTQPLSQVVNPVLTGNTPTEFRKTLEAVKAKIISDPSKPRVVVINAWNEWPESSILEPEARHGYGYLEAIRDTFPR